MSVDLLKDHLLLEYMGPRVENGRMDAYRVAQQILAFSDYLSVISSSVYGGEAEIRTDVQGFRGGSFDIEFVFQIAGPIATMFSASPLTAKDMIGVIKQSFDAWIHLKGQPPKSTMHAQDDASLICIENNYGDVKNYHPRIINVIADPKAGIAAERFIKEPLESGIDLVRIASSQYHESAEAKKEDAGSFIAVVTERPLSDEEVDAYLILESPTFKEGNKWKFYDGSSSFYADMGDKEFLAKIEDGLRFGKGDVLKVTMRNVQKSTVDSIRLERYIVQVHEHRPAARQVGMFK